MTISTELIFSEDNPCNTQIYASGDAQFEKPLYTVETPPVKDGEKTLTKVYKGTAGGELLGTLEWHDALSDVVILPGEKGQSMHSWMKGGIIPYTPKQTRSFKDNQGRKYSWKGVTPGGKMLLYSSDIENDAIVGFEKTWRSKPDEKAKLVLAPRAEEICDLVVLSFLFLEKERRIQDQASQSRGDVLGQGLLNVTGVVHKGGV